MGQLKYKWRVGQAATMGKVKSVASPFPALSGNYTYHNELNADSYVVESPDAIEPATKDAHTVMRYSENNLSAGVAYQGDYKTCVLEQKTVNNRPDGLPAPPGDAGTARDIPFCPTDGHSSDPEQSESHRGPAAFRGTD